MDYTELKLREEVEFWRELIEQWENHPSEEVKSRMRETLRYAEQKLARYWQAQKNSGKESQANGS